MVENETPNEAMLKMQLRIQYKDEGIEALIEHFIKDRRKIFKKVDNLEEDARTFDIEVTGLIRYFEGQFN